MTLHRPNPTPATGGIKAVPQDQALRDVIRFEAETAMRDADRTRPLLRAVLEEKGRAILTSLQQPESYLGFVMVALSNAFWTDQFAAIAPSRRLFLLPHCLRQEEVCAGSYGAAGLVCGGCGACAVSDLNPEAEALGYKVITAESTSAVIIEVLEGRCDAVLGVACLDSLEKSFNSVAALGIPNMAVPLLRDGCVATQAEVDQVQGFLRLQGGTVSTATRSYLPLLRAAGALTDTASLQELLADYMTPATLAGEGDDPQHFVERVGLEWLRHGGKKLRPFVLLASYAVAANGEAALAPDADITALVPVGVRRLALAIEVLHKASLVHDDLMDGDEFRYGRETIHHQYGMPQAINVGDYLLGLGYHLIADCAPELGGDCIAEIMSELMGSQTDLCNAEGAEMLWTTGGVMPAPVDILAMYAVKTGRGFQVSVHGGLRAAGLKLPNELLHRYASYVGQAYQVLNDLDDWDEDSSNKVRLGRDVLAGHPTVLRAFAEEAGGGAALEEWRRRAVAATDGEVSIDEIQALYERLGAFEKTRRLAGRLRERALALATEAPTPALCDLLDFLVRMILREETGIGK